MSVAALFPTTEGLAKMETFAHLCAAAELPKEEWDKVSEALGSKCIESIKLLPATSADAWKAAINSIAASPIFQTKINIIFNLCRLKKGAQVIDLTEQKISASDSKGTCAEAQSSANAEDVEWVALKDYWNQGSKVKVRMLSLEKIRAAQAALAEKKGMDPSREKRATDAQVSVFFWCSREAHDAAQL